jgi:CheY-like chemotaxis protein
MAAVHRCETNLVGGSEAILLVEDDSAVRRTFARQLRRLGYRVHEAEGGQLALDILNQGTPIDLLLTDVVMPGMSGPELVNTVRAQWNGIAVVIMSGYAEAGTSGLHGLRRSDLKLQKPVDREELARTIRDALDRNRA